MAQDLSDTVRDKLVSSFDPVHLVFDCVNACVFLLIVNCVQQMRTASEVYLAVFFFHLAHITGYQGHVGWLWFSVRSRDCFPEIRRNGIAAAPQVQASSLLIA